MTEWSRPEARVEDGALTLMGDAVTVSRYQCPSGRVEYMLNMPVRCINEPPREFTWKVRIGVDEETAQELADLIHALSQGRPEATQKGETNE